MSYKSYCKEGTQERAILDLHFQGYAPSQIDSELELLLGTAHRVVTEYWAWDKRQYVKSKKSNVCV